jgi:hypothetical protein
MELGLKTGDLVLFSGDSIVSDIVEEASQSKWAHAGVIWVDLNDQGSKIQILESVVHIFKKESQGSMIPSNINIKSGVQINLFDEILDPQREIVTTKLFNKVAIRRLKNPLSIDQISKFATYANKHIGIPYEKKLLPLIEAAIGPERISKILTEIKERFPKEEPKIRNLLVDPDLSSVFCSQLVVEMYEEVGIIPSSKIELFSSPGDLSSLSKLPEFKNGNILGPEEILIKPTERSRSRCCAIL